MVRLGHWAEHFIADQKASDLLNSRLLDIQQTQDIKTPVIFRWFFESPTLDQEPKAAFDQIQALPEIPNGLLLFCGGTIG